MRIISFSEVRFVRAILEGKKTQTIRPMFSWVGHPMHQYVNKLVPIHKVGDTVKLVYKQRVLKKDNKFCSACGHAFDMEDFNREKDIHDQLKDVCCFIPKEKKRLLPKHFATAIVTDVFETDLYITEPGEEMKNVEGMTMHALIADFDESLDEFAKKDGFKDFEEMFQWFDKAYDLSQPRRFAVYRFKVTK